VQVENLHPQFKKPWLDPIFLSLATSLCGDKISIVSDSSFLVATRFHLVEGKCKLKTCTHNSNCATFLCGDKISIVSDSSFLWRQDFILSKASAR